jgi:hypothetical protein
MQRALHDAAFLGALDEAGGLEHREVLHEARQRHVVRRGELADRAAAARQLGEDRAAGTVGERREQRVEPIV